MTTPKTYECPKCGAPAYTIDFSDKSIMIRRGVFDCWLCDACKYRRGKHSDPRLDGVPADGLRTWTDEDNRVNHGPSADDDDGPLAVFASLSEPGMWWQGGCGDDTFSTEARAVLFAAGGEP